MQVKLTEAQYQIATDNHRFRIICAGRRFGKSTLSRLIAYKWALEKPGLYWIVSPTYTQSVQNHWLEMKKEIPLDWIASEYKERSITFKNGSRIELKGAENPDTLRGVKLGGLIIDEIASIRSWDWLWHEVLNATLVDNQAPAIFISTPKGYNHFYKLFTDGQQNDADFKSWRFTSYDNPHMLPEELDKIKEKTEENYFAQEYMADFRKYTGVVYKNFDRLIHVKELPDFKPVMYLRGVDRGFTNPTAVPIISVDADGRWYQTHEIYKKGLVTTDLLNELKAMDAITKIEYYEYQTMDSEAAGDIAELNGLGIDFIPVSKVSGEKDMEYVRYKIQRFSERLKVQKDGQPRYYVHPRCTNTIWEFETYAYPEYKDDTRNPTEAPMKLNDHCLTGDTLVDTTHGQIEIQDLVGTEGTLYTQNGKIRRFYDVRQTGMEQIYEVEFTDGRIVTCSSEHPFRLANGDWCPAYLLIQKDLIQSVMYGSQDNIIKQARVQWEQLLLWQREILQTFNISLQRRATSQSSMAISQWFNSQELSHSPQGWGLAKQPDRELGVKTSTSSFKPTYDAREKTEAEGMGRQDTAISIEMARNRRSKDNTYQNWQRLMESEKESKNELLTLWQRVQNILSDTFQVLPSQLRSQPQTAQVKRITRHMDKQEVFTLEVQDTHAFSINGGIIVSNCMDALGDLNAMYEHDYQAREKKLWDSKLPGTYVRPSLPDEDENTIMFVEDSGGFEEDSL